MFCISGYGGSDTHALILNDGKPNPHKSAGTPYGTISPEQILSLAKNPPSVDKEVSQWFIPSSYHDYDGRSHAVQRERGVFHWLAADIDQGGPSLEQLSAAIDKSLGEEIYRIIYSSRSSTPDNQKWRVLVPLSTPLNGTQYTAYQTTFFDGLEALGIVPDRTLSRTGQLIYLPNRGEHYEHHISGSNSLDATNHPMSGRAEIYLSAPPPQEDFREEGSRSPLAAFRRKHSIASLLSHYGYENKPGTDDWRSPNSQSGSYSTRDRGDHWISLSHSDAALGIGRATPNGSRYGDAFDLYVHYQCGGDRERALSYARECLADEDAARYGDATSGLVISGGELLPAPIRSPGNGYDIFQGLDYIGGRPCSTRAAERSLHDNRELEKIAASAKDNRWGGDWVKEVPFEIVPSKLEWLAWHAPGLIGEAVRAKAPQSSRFSLVPLLAGATVAAAHLGQGKIVSRLWHHITPPAVMLFLIGNSGSGKGASGSMFYDVVNLCKDQHLLAARRTGGFASGQSFKDFMMHHSNHVTIIQSEGGALRAAGRGDRNYESFAAVLTDAFTEFHNGIEATHTKSDEKASKRIENPTVSSLMSSTPEKLFSSIDATDAESGWLGRYLFIKLEQTRTVMGAPPDVVFAQSTRDRVDYLTSLLPPLPDPNNPRVWTGRSGQCFHVLDYTPDAISIYETIIEHYDDLQADPRRSPAAKAVYSRAAEACNRLATVAAVSKMTPSNLVVDAECITWARMLVEESVSLVTSRIDEEINNAEDTIVARIRRSVVRVFRRAETDKEYFESLGPRGSGRGPGGEIILGLNAIRRKVKDNTKASASQITQEIDGMIQDEELFEVTKSISGPGPKTRWLRLGH